MLSADDLPENLAPVLDKLAEVLNDHQIGYALIGDVGVALRGPIRPTRDIDLLLTIPQLKLPGLIEALVAAGFTIDLNDTIERWNRDHLVDFSFGSVRIDWLKPVLPAFEHILARARWEQIESRQIRVADAEGLILLKLISFRSRDVEDIKGILAANAGRLDLDWVRQEWLSLVGENDPKTEQFEQLVREFYEGADSGHAR